MPRTQSLFLPTIPSVFSCLISMQSVTGLSHATQAQVPPRRYSPCPSRGSTRGHKGTQHQLLLPRQILCIPQHSSSQTAAEHHAETPILRALTVPHFFQVRKKPTGYFNARKEPDEEIYFSTAAAGPPFPWLQWTPLQKGTAQGAGAVPAGNTNGSSTTTMNSPVHRERRRLHPAWVSMGSAAGQTDSGGAGQTPEGQKQPALSFSCTLRTDPAQHPAASEPPRLTVSADTGTLGPRYSNYCMLIIRQDKGCCIHRLPGNHPGAEDGNAVMRIRPSLVLKHHLLSFCI